MYTKWLWVSLLGIIRATGAAEKDATQPYGSNPDRDACAQVNGAGSARPDGG